MMVKDSLDRYVIIGDQVGYYRKYWGYNIGRIVSFTEGGNPRVVDWNNKSGFASNDRARALINGFLKIEPV